jgi:hypothetical protein
MTTKRMWKATGMALALAFIAGVGAAGATPAKARQASYLVISPHTPEQCLAALARAVETKHLERFEYGCAHGDHTGYARVTAASSDEALAIVPSEERGAARAIELDRFTPEQIRAFHQAKK